MKGLGNNQKKLPEQGFKIGKNRARPTYQNIFDQRRKKLVNKQLWATKREYRARLKLPNPHSP